MKACLYAVLCLLWCSLGVRGQGAGTPADPFTTLAEALNVPAAGNYNFRLGSVDFTTYVSADGYVQIIYDNSSTAELLPTTYDLSFQTYGILAADVLAELGAITEIRISSDDLTQIDAVTPATAALKDRILRSRSLMSGTADNANNDFWTGTGSANLRRDATVDAADKELRNEIYHTNGSGGGVHWIPLRGDRSTTYLNTTPAPEGWTLWVRSPPPTRGSPGNPFTTLYEARSVATAGVYSFNLGGTRFSTYVDASGYVQVVRDFGNGVGAIPASNDITQTARGVLPPAALASLTDADELRFTSSESPTTLDAVSFEQGYLDRIVANQAVMYDNTDNGLNDSWTGTGSNFLQVNATVARTAPRPTLATEVYHTFGNGAGMTWFPGRDDQALSFNDGNIADNESLTLWVRAPEPVQPLGSAANPFTSLNDAAAVTTPGRYFFDLGGPVFDTYVDAQGWVRLALDIRDAVAAELPTSNSLPANNNGILTPAALASLTEMTEVRISSSVPNYLDARTANSGVIGKVLANQPIKSDVRDNDINTQWTGTGSSEINKLAGEGQFNDIYTTLSQEIFHNYYGPNGGEGLHWIPSRGDMSLKYQVDIAQGESFALWGRGAPTCAIVINSVDITDESCPGAEDGSLDIDATCADCTNDLEYSIDGAGYLVNNTRSRLPPGNYIVYAREQANARCVTTLPVTIAPGVDTEVPTTSPLPPRELNICDDGPTTIPAPTANDACVGSVVATTTDNTTFSAAGNYSVDWVFDDGNGNTVTRREEVTVYGPVYPLPFRETAEQTSTSLACWEMLDQTGDGNNWTVATGTSFAHGGDWFFFLPANGDSGQDDRLESPHLTLLPATPYALDFAYRPAAGGFQEHLRALLLNAGDGSIVDTLFFDMEGAATYREISLLFEVPTEGDYKLQFYSLTAPGSNGLVLDDIAVYEYSEPADGASNLVGAGDDACITLESYGVYGKAYARFLDPTGRLALELDPNGNNLGDVTVELRDYAAPPLAPYDNRYYLSRHVNITPENGPGPYTINGGVRVRLYFTEAELQEFLTATGQSGGWNDLVISHYSDVNEDCDLLNSTGTDFQIETVQAATAYASTAYALSFTTTSFSEFGATTAEGAFPVDLRAFTARALPDANRLDWAVDSEIDFSHYAVERSQEGQVFTEIARVEGAGEARYSWVDTAPATLQYYRLRMVDFDGSATYSKIVTVRRAEVSANEVLRAYPSPTHGRVTLSFAGAEKGEARLRIFDSVGRLVRRKRVPVNRQHNEHEVSLADLPPGYYTLTLTDGARVRSVRVARK